MQLSDDGNFQWDGNEWVPVEQAAAPAAPMVVSPHVEMATPVAAAPARPAQARPLLHRRRRLEHAGALAAAAAARAPGRSE